MVIKYSKITNQPGIRLRILLVVSWTGKIIISLSAFAPDNLVSQDGFGSPVPRQPAHLHTQAESGAYLQDSYRVPPRRLFIYLLLALGPSKDSLFYSETFHAFSAQSRPDHSVYIPQRRGVTTPGIIFHHTVIHMRFVAVNVSASVWTIPLRNVISAEAVSLLHARITSRKVRKAVVA